jgi:hypothetical protein
MLPASDSSSTFLFFALPAVLVLTPFVYPLTCPLAAAASAATCALVLFLGIGLVESCMTMTSFFWPTESYVCSMVHPFPLGAATALRRTEPWDEVRGVPDIAVSATAIFFLGGMLGGDAE